MALSRLEDGPQRKALRADLFTYCMLDVRVVDGDTLAAQIDAAEEIIIVTSKVDKYDRYLADVYRRQRTGGEMFLNNALLENRHAVRMDPSSQKNWIP